MSLKTSLLTMTTTGSTADSASSTPSRSRAQHRAPRESAHMNVLGRDGTDLDVPSVQPPSSSSHQSTTQIDNGGDTIASKSALTDSSCSSLDENPTVPDPSNNNLSTNGNTSGSWWGKLTGRGNNNNYQGITPNVNNGGLSASPLHFDENSASIPVGGLDNPTIEDQLKQDCHFFYQGLDDQPSPEKRSNRGLRPLSTALNKVPRIMNSRDGARFHARYQQLNQDLNEKFERYPHHHDLALAEEDGVEAAAASTTAGDEIASQNITDLQHSSLFYEQNGRLLMRLPRDQVRLVMDNDLESGIVSVEQWRAPDDAETASYSVISQQQHQQSEYETKPPLRYVMTVPDDLYRRVVSEMSYQLQPPCWGFFKCCHFHGDGERADIGLALVILTVVLILLFIGTVDFHLK